MHGQTFLQMLMNVMKALMAVLRCAQIRLVAIPVLVAQVIAWPVTVTVVQTLMNVPKREMVVIKLVQTLLVATPVLVAWAIV